MIKLRGMTWNHPRGIDPLLAHARQFALPRGIEIEWDARLLEDFEAFPLDELASRYDLLVIDHPHVGMAAESGCLLALDELGRDVHRDTVGHSQESYFYEGQQWALAIDAAAQVSARRAGSMNVWPTSWDEVIELGRSGRMLCPLSPVHALMCFYTLCANGGHPCATTGAELVYRSVGEEALEQLVTIARLVPDSCLSMNPIDVLERMSSDEQLVYAPLVYGYVSYARDGFREARIEFGNIPQVCGSALGGTGIAVSARSLSREAAVEVAFDLASSETQRGLYASHGGQPVHLAAWDDDVVNKQSHDFYRNTRATLDASYVRPRFDGYVAFQEAAGKLVVLAIRRELSIASAVARLNELFVEAQPNT